MQRTMTIRQAVRWAESKDALHSLSAVYDASWKAGNIIFIGSRDKCAEFLRSCGCQGHFNTSAYFTDAAGRMLRVYDLDTLAEELYESDSEAMCIPDLSEQREWA